MFGSILSAVAPSIIGGLFGKASNDANVDAQNATNAQSIELANSAHQREVKDLSAAGLNPMLSYFGKGSSTPNLTAPQTKPIFSSEEIQGGLSAASQRTLNSANTAKVQADTETIKSQGILNGAMTAKANAEAQAATATAKEIEARTPTYAKNIQHTDSQILELAAQVKQLGAQFGLTSEETRRVGTEIVNNIKTGRRIDAETASERMRPALIRAQTLAEQVRPANIQADTSLKGIETATHKADLPLHELKGHASETFLNSAKGTENFIGHIMSTFDRGLDPKIGQSIRHGGVVLKDAYNKPFDKKTHRQFAPKGALFRN
ncbi:MAG: DNA pilot protein [Microvirus sp.]|nr:MAG: DNA pilot protein [Microvirus sp.]